MRKIQVGLIQQANTSDIRTNLMNLAKSIEACAARGAQLIVLQELHNSLYFCQTENTLVFDLAESIPGPSTGFYSELAAANGVVLVTSLFEKRAPGLYHNTAVVFDSDGSIAGKYRKMHIPDDPAYYEKFYFTPGDIGFEPVQTSLGKLGVLVCWDQWYPEAARLMALKGAELLIYPTAIGWESSDADDEKIRQLNAWIISQRAHAVANGIPVISVNRVGHEPDPSMRTDGILFWGNSFAVAAVIPHVACIEIIVAHKGRHAVQLLSCKSRETFQDIRLGTAHMDVSGQNHIQIGTVGVDEGRKDTL